MLFLASSSATPSLRRRSHDTPFIEPLESRIAPSLIFGIQSPPLVAQKLVSFDSASPQNLLTNTSITGLNGGEKIVAMDFRPSDGVLFAASDTERLFTINTTTGAATFVGTFTVGASATQVFDIDFNPINGGIRALDDFDQNFRIINPATPASTFDTGTSYATGDPNFNNFPFYVSASAYSNNFPGATQATYFGIDTLINNGQGVLVRIGNVNGTTPGADSAGTGQVHTIGVLGLPNTPNGTDPRINSTVQSGFDIAANGTAFAALNAFDTTAGTYRSQFYTINLSTGAATRVNTISDGINVIDDIAVAPPSFSINSPSVTEGNGGTKTLTFTVSLSDAHTNTATIHYATANNSATTADNDYVAITDTVLTFPPGTNQQSFNVTINGDMTDEPNESFFVNLSNASGAFIAVGQGTGTILNDDGAPNISIDDRTVPEGLNGATMATFTVTLSAPSSQTVTVNYQTALDTTTTGHTTQTNDFFNGVLPSGTVTFNPGQTTKTIDIAINGDSSPENNERYFVNLSSPSNATISDPQGLGIILNDDLSFSISDAPAAAEGAAGVNHNAVFTITLDGENNIPVQVHYATADGSATVANGDYNATSGDVVFPVIAHGASTSATQTINVQVNGDAIVEPDEMFTVVLTAPTGGASISDNSGSHTITNDDSGGGFTPITDFNAFDAAFTGGVFVATGDVNGDGHPDVVVGAGAGGGPQVKVLSGNGGGGLFSFFAFDPGFTGGVRVAVGDVNGDGNADIITGAGPGGLSQVKVFSGANGALLQSFFAYPGFNVGVFVAAGDVDGGGTDIITGPGAGAPPVVKVFNGSTGGLSRTIVAYRPDFTGGVTVAAGRVDADNLADIITGTEAGEPMVKVFSGDSSAVLQSFFAYDPVFPSGVFVGAGDYNNDGRADIITGPGAGLARPVNVFSGTTLAVLDTFTPYEGSFTGGVHVAGGLITTDPFSEIVTGPGAGRGPLVKIFDRHASTPPVQFAINNVEISEGTGGSKVATIQVGAFGSHAGTVTVDFATANGTALAPSDYSSTTGRLNFAPGEMLQTIQIPIITDSATEPTENFTVTLSNPVGGTLAIGTGTVTIKNDDLPPASFFLTAALSASGTSIATGDFNGDGTPDFVVGPEAGAEPRVTIVSGADGATPLGSFLAYAGPDKFGVSLAVGDFNLDGSPDIFTVTTLQNVKVFDGTTIGSPTPSTLADFKPFTGDAFSPGIAAGDVDGDGKADIIVGSNASRKVSVFKSSGNDATLLVSLDLPGVSPIQPFTVAAGDVNGDGKADIIVGFGAADGVANPKTVTVLNGATGDVNAFTPLNTFLAFNQIPGLAPTVAAADLDGDGKAEIIAGSGPTLKPAQVKIFNGLTGAVIDPTTLGPRAARAGQLEQGAIPVYDSTFKGGVNVAIADMNGDGIPDIITAPGPNKVRGALVQLNILDVAGQLPRSFITPPPPPFGGAVSVALGDLNGDSIADIITAGAKSSSVSVVDGKTGGALFSFVAFAGKSKGLSVAAGDVDKDGIADIIVGSANKPRVEVHSGADGSLKLALTIGADIRLTGGVSVAAADYNHDFAADIVAGSLTSNRYFIMRGGNSDDPEFFRGFAFGTTLSTKFGLRVATGDLNGDGFSEIIAGRTKSKPGQPQVAVMAGGGDHAQISSFQAFEPGYIGGLSVAVADVNGDGKADIIAAPTKGHAGDVKVFDFQPVLMGTGAATQIARFDPFGIGMKKGINVAAGDINGDGVADIISATGGGPLPMLKITSGAAG